MRIECLWSHLRKQVDGGFMSLRLKLPSIHHFGAIIICNSYITGVRDVWHLLHRGPRALAPKGRGQ